MARTYSSPVCRLAFLALVLVAALPMNAARAQWHGGGGGWHGGGGGWHGGGGGWHGGGGMAAVGAGMADGVGVEAGVGAAGAGDQGSPSDLLRRRPIIRLLLITPACLLSAARLLPASSLSIPPAAYPYSPPATYYAPQYNYGYTQGYYGGAVQRPQYANSAATDPRNCGTPDEPKACTR